MRGWAWRNNSINLQKNKWPFMWGKCFYSYQRVETKLEEEKKLKICKWENGVWKKKPINWCMKVGKQEGRKGDTVTREGRDFVLILTNHYNWSQRVPRVMSLSLIINPLFFFWLIIIRRKKKARRAKDNSRLSGVFTFYFYFFFLYH